MKSVFVNELHLATIIAPRWEITLAKIFGKRFMTHDFAVRVHGARWRGKTYIFRIEEL